MSRVGVGLGQGWTIKLINMLNISTISHVGLDYGKNTLKFWEIFAQQTNRTNKILFCSFIFFPFFILTF